MYRWIGLFVGLLWFSAASATPELSLETGAGIFYNKESNLVLLGVTEPAPRFLNQKSYHQFNIGHWDGPCAASFIGLSKGLQWDFDNSFVRLSTGGSLISDTSYRLSTAFQFYEQFMINFSFDKSSTIGLSYRHWSNAYIKEPNFGMDFVGVQVQLKW